MSSSERSIPHLRDIFGLNGSNGYMMHNNSQHNTSNNHYHNNNQYQNGNGGYVGNSDPYDPYDHQPMIDPTVNNKKHSKKKRDNSKTLTSGDVKTLERHLSMKKTIRKKIMRDLQQAFVEDPNEFRIENSNQEQLKAEIRVEALRFGASEKPSRKSDNFLDMLRGEKPTSTSSTSNYDYSNGSNRDYDYDSQPAPAAEKQSFWRRFTMKNKTKR